MGKPDSKREVEQYADAWSRFERAVDVVAKSPPQHRKQDAKDMKRKSVGRRKSSRQAPGR